MSERFRPTWLEIDLDVIAANIRHLRERTPERARLMAVVKADAYGHGAVQVARVALANGADWLGVAIPEEGVQLREAGIDAPVLVLGGVTETGADAVARYGLTQTVFDERTVWWLEEAGLRHRVIVPVHVKVDTGMGRIGARDGQALRALIALIESLPHLRLDGVFTHFATSDDEELAFTGEQTQRFDEMVLQLKKERSALLLHAANSAALLRQPEWLAYDMVRAGIALYVDPALPGGVGSGLGDAMRWVTRAVHVKDIEPGETVSYGRVFAAKRPTRVMTVPVGYADGYHRAIGGVGCALVRGVRAPVIGRVCMDQTMLDVTDIPGAAIDDEVVLLGRQGGERITAHEWGAWCGMIAYEAVLSPTGRVPRVYRLKGDWV